MIRRLSALGALFAVVSLSPSALAAPAAATVVVANVQVPYGDLDTRAPSGQTALKARLDTAARQVCGGNPAFHSQYREAPGYVRADFERCRTAAQRGAYEVLQQRGIIIADSRN